MLIGDTQLKRIRTHEPEIRLQESLLKAAVAIILRDGDLGTEVLLMQRAKHEQDPWSGQMSFPGGKIDPDDVNSKATAVREAYEEVGALLSDVDFVGRLDDLYGLKINGVFSVHVACYVFKPSAPLTLMANEEVADMVWLPLKMLDDRDNGYAYAHHKDPALSMPAVMIDAPKEQVLWGMSLRMLLNLYELLELPMPVLSEQDKEYLRTIEQRNLSKANADKVADKLKSRTS